MKHPETPIAEFLDSPGIRIIMPKCEKAIGRTTKSHGYDYITEFPIIY